MKLFRSLTLATMGLGALGFGLSAAAGCGSSTSAGPDSGTGGTHHEGGSDGAGPTGPGFTSPKKPSGPTTSSKTPLNFAVHQLFLGDTDYNGMSDMNAWNQYGYNIDGKITTSTSTNVCTLLNGGGSFGMAAQEDGTGPSGSGGGVDNSFGHNVYNGILLTIDSSASTTVNSDLSAGKFTLMFDITGLDSTSSQTATGLTAQAFAGGVFNGTPTFTSADNWPILGGSSLLQNPSGPPPYKSKIQFGDSYVVNGTWVSGTPTDITLALSISGYSLNLSINQAVITFQHSSANHGGNGIISGVLKTSTLVSAIQALAGRIGGKAFCGGGAIMGILDEIKEASDIMDDGTNNPGQPCDAISIGLGFTADVIGQPMEIAPMACPKADPCSDAGAPACDSGAPMDSGSSGDAMGMGEGGGG